jgi:hypothetical protein
MKNLRSRAYFLFSLAAGTGAAATFVFGGHALAGDTPTVAVLGLEAGDGVPDSVTVGITDALRQRMSMLPGYHLVQGRDLVEVKLVFSCPDEAPACMSQAAKSLGTSRLLFGTVKKAGSDAYNVTLKLFDADKEVVESWTADQLSHAQSTGPALRAPVQKWIATLTGQSLPGTLHMQGGVMGATVAVDGVSAGVMGASGLTITNVAAGKHEITVTKAGYAPAKKSVILASGDTREVAIELAAEGSAAVPMPAETPSAETPAVEPAATAATQPAETAREGLTSSVSDGHRVGYKVAAWLSLAGGLAGVGVGIYYSYLVIDANSRLDPYRTFPCPSGTGICDKNGNPPRPRDQSTSDWITKTRSLGDDYQIYQWIGYGVGAAFLATSAVFFYYGYMSHPSGATADARRSSFQLAPVVSPDGVGAMAFMTF